MYSVKRGRGLATALTSLAFSSISFAVSEGIQQAPLDEWEKKKLNCPKCIVYIKSPCRKEFSRAGKCSERAHESNISVDTCVPDILPLLACEKRNIEYFQSYEHQVKS